MGARTPWGARLRLNWCLHLKLDEFTEGSFFDSKDDMCLLKAFLKFRASLEILLHVLSEWRNGRDFVRLALGDG